MAKRSASTRAQGEVAEEQGAPSPSLPDSSNPNLPASGQNGQSLTPIDTRPLFDLAQLVISLDAKRELCTQIGQQLEPLKLLKVRTASGEATFMAVEADMQLLQELQQILSDAQRALQELVHSPSRDAIVQCIVTVQTLLADGKWDAALTVKDRLAEKLNDLAKLVQGYRAELAPQNENIRRLRLAVNRAIAARAPIRTQAKRLERLEALQMTVERVLRGEQPINDLLSALKTLAAESATIDTDLVQIEQDTEQTERFSRQADLLLLQSPLDQFGRYHYAVLLRTPSEPGAHGINVQGSSTLVAQDRTLMGDAIERITEAVERGSVRGAHDLPAAPVPVGEADPLAESPPVANGPENTPPDIAVAVPEPGADNEVLLSPPSAAHEPLHPLTPDAALATRAATRHFVFGPAKAAPTQVLDVTNLVREMGDLMYRLFMPEQMQQYLRDTQCALTITTNDLELPWEFMYYAPLRDDRQNAPQSEVDAASFLCLNRPIGRMPMGRALPLFDVPRIRRPPKRQFLLVADPTGDLPGASREIQLLQEWLLKEWSDQIEIELLEGKDATGRMLNQALRSDKYDVIHYSGHAFFDKTDPDLSGLLLHEREIFFAQKIRRLLEGRPLVFLNACQSALAANEEEDDGDKTNFNLQKPAEGLASSFIYGGALGCIGSLWPIYDAPSARFAIQFYHYVLEGYMIGEAMRLTRLAIKEKDPITWAAFVLYGDPTFRLVE
ncbi:MAG: CHAT domain-containing protein [Caldilineaceae bacterium]